MSPLTKAFTLLVAFLAVLLVALVVPFIANTDDYAAQVQTLRGELGVARAAAEIRQGEIEAQQAAENERRAGLESENRQLTARITELQTQLIAAESKYNAEVQGKGQLTASVRTLTASNQQYAKLLETLQGQLRAALERNVDQGKQVIELTDTVLEKNNTLERLEREVRRYMERVQGHEEQIAGFEQLWQQVPDELKLRLAGDGTDAGQAALVIPDVPIEGQILRVEKTAGDLTLVEINVGLRDRVQPGMKFIISREGRYLGDLVVSLMDEDVSAGRVELAQGDIQPGDRIYAGKF